MSPALQYTPSSFPRRRRPLAQVVLVTGKGGVGKTTIAAGLAVAAARRHGQACFVEFGDGDSGRRALRGEGVVEHVILTHEDAILRVVSSVLGGNLLARVFLASQSIQRLVRASPGLRELALLESIRAIAAERPNTRVFVDMPSSGHGVAWLRVPAQMQELLGTGPLYAVTDRVARELLEEERASLVVVALPERMVLRETVELCSAMIHQVGIVPARIVVNRMPAELPAEALVAARALVDGGEPLASAAGPLLELLEARYAARTEALDALRGLGGEVGTSPVILPEAPVDPTTSEVADWLLAEAGI